MSKQPCTYILASGPFGTIYIGVTSDLVARLHQHRSGEVPGFTSRYGVLRLVRFEVFDEMITAIASEKQLKRWHREWKINLIESDNPHWEDLAVGLGFDPLLPRLPKRRGRRANQSSSSC
ncbi:GIY-YIG nuclease family protein [Sphingomonas sp. 28-62-11]|uniref:GIY-YIG nuclease family protein n=1 Tax=Sphingomonas sp. 28-62-11 TaxID=1970432 RepID=UPI000BDC3DB1|nr:MAG: endonuclease [Sphingomonas sp. 28-62-11]